MGNVEDRERPSEEDSDDEWDDGSGEALEEMIEHADHALGSESFGIPAWRCETASDFAKRLDEALASDGPSLIAVPIDYSPDVAIVGELEEEVPPT